MFQAEGSAIPRLRLSLVKAQMEHRSSSRAHGPLPLFSPADGRRPWHRFRFLAIMKSTAKGRTKKHGTSLQPFRMLTSRLKRHFGPWQGLLLSFFPLYTYIASRREITKSVSRVTGRAPIARRGAPCHVSTPSGGSTRGQFLVSDLLLIGRFVLSFFIACIALCEYMIEKSWERHCCDLLRKRAM